MTRFELSEFLFRLVDDHRMKLGEYNRLSAMEDAERLMDELNGPPLLVDSRTLTGIEEIARRLVRESRGEVIRSKVFVQALSDYMMEKGMRPNFKVKADK